VPPFDDFTVSLKKIGTDSEDPEDIINGLQNGQVDISNLLYKFKGSKTIKNMAYDTIFEYLKEEERIINLWNLVDTNLLSLEEELGVIKNIRHKVKELTEYEQEEQDEKIQYHEDVYTIIEETIKLLAEELIDDFGNEFYNDEKIISVVKRIGNPNIKTRGFLSKVKFEQFRTQEDEVPIFESKYHNELIDILSSYFSNQKEELGTLIKTGKRTCSGKLDFKGKIVTLAHTFRYLRLGGYHGSVNNNYEIKCQVLKISEMKKLEEWIVNNFTVKGKILKQGTIHKDLKKLDKLEYDQTLIQLVEKDLIEQPIPNKKGEKKIK
jgi:hypothetical protein